MLPSDLQQKLAAPLRQLEQYRQTLRADEQQARSRARRKAKWIAAAFAAVALASVVEGSVAGFGSGNIFVIIVAVIIGLFVTLAVANRSLSEFSTDYEDAYKTEINSVIVKHFSPALTYNATDGLGRDAFASSSLFDTPDTYATSDLVSGSCGKTQIRLARVAAWKRHDTGGKNRRTYYTTIFDGVLLIIEAGRAFRGSTRILMNHNLPAGVDMIAGKVGRALQKLAASMSHDQLVQPGNSAFEKEFSVHSSDPDEARGILSASLMERMLKLRQRSDAPMRFCFENTTLTIAIDNDAENDDPFDPDFDLPATDAAQLEKIYAHWDFYLGVADALGGA